MIAIVADLSCRFLANAAAWHRHLFYIELNHGNPHRPEITRPRYLTSDSCAWPQSHEHRSFKEDLLQVQKEPYLAPFDYVGLEFLVWAEPELDTTVVLRCVFARAAAHFPTVGLRNCPIAKSTLVNGSCGSVQAASPVSSSWTQSQGNSRNYSVPRMVL